MRRLALVGVLAGCAPPVCSLDNAIVELGRPAHSCGDFSAGFTMTSDPAPYYAARDCLVAAIGDHEPVIATWFSAGIDSSSQGAWVGIDRGGDYEVFAIYAGNDGEIADTVTTTRRCLIVGDEGACADYATSLCLECGTGPSEASCGK